jgi:hypothetical protein
MSVVKAEEGKSCFVKLPSVLSPIRREMAMQCSVQNLDSALYAWFYTGRKDKGRRVGKLNQDRGGDRRVLKASVCPCRFIAYRESLLTCRSGGIGHWLLN